MSVLSTLASTIKTTLVTSTSAKVYLAGGVLAVSLVTGGIFYWKHLTSTIAAQTEAINTKDGQINTLTNARNVAVSQRDEAQAKTAALDKAKNESDTKLENYRNDNDKLAKELADALAKDQCAKSNVPSGARKLQQQSISRFNAMYPD